MTAVLALAFVGAAHALSVDIVVPETDPAEVYQYARTPFEAVCWDEKGTDVTELATFTWSFPDAKASTVGNPATHRFHEPGKFAVSVNAAIGRDTGSDEIAIVVHAVDPQPARDGMEESFLFTANGHETGHQVSDDVGLLVEETASIWPLEWFWTEFAYYDDGDWVVPQDQSGDPSYAWFTTVDPSQPNEAVRWRAKLLIAEPWSEDPPVIFTVYVEGTWTVNNTVVKSTAPPLIIHHATDTSHTIGWDLTHCADFDPEFTMTVTIHDLEGTTVATLVRYNVPLEEQDPQVVWNTNLPEEDGIYTYKIHASHNPPPPWYPCVDRDKSEVLVPTLDKFYYFDKDVQAGTLKGVVKYTLNRLAADTVTIRFYDPDLDEYSGSALTEQDNTAGTHWSDVYTLTGVTFDQNDEPVGPISCVLFADESATDAANNRDGLPKPALQKGSTELQERPIDLDIAGTTEDTEETVGGFVVLNSEDDDGNEAADLGQTGTVTDEDDLIAIALAYDGSGELKLEATEGGGRVKVWTSATKGTQVTLPATWQVPNNPPPAQLYVEGVAVSEDARDVELRLSLTVGGAEVGFDSVRATVWDVESVEWYAINSALDTNPNPGGGQRIFPGKATPEDEIDRSEVGVRVQVTPEVEGVTVAVEVTDPDDPHTDDEPIDPNGSAGNDNRGTAGGLTEQEPVTDANGIAETTFSVSMQPGDNFRTRAGATVDHLLFPGAYQGSGLLTVWRKLHTEVDSMGAPSGVVETGLITAVNDNGNGTISVTTDVDLDDSVDRFVPGEFTDSVGAWPILANTAGQNFVVTVEKVHGETLPSPDDAFEAADDDVIPADVPDPITTVLVEKFAPAYVLPVFDGGGDPGWDDSDAPFALNLSDYNGSAYGGLEAQAQLSRDSASTQIFWTLHCLGCFQGIRDRDNDPGSEGCIQGISNGKTALVFSEHHREYSQTEDRRAHTLVHEIGHSFGLEDEYKWQPPPYPADPNYNGIMYWVWKGVFTDGNIADIRSIDCPSALFFYQY